MTWTKNRLNINFRFLVLISKGSKIHCPVPTHRRDRYSAYLISETVTHTSQTWVRYFTDTIHFSHLEVFRFIFIPSLLFNIFFFLSFCLSLFLSLSFCRSYCDLSLLVVGGFLLHLITHTHTHPPAPDPHPHTLTQNEWLARRRDLYLTAHNTHKRETSMQPGGIWTHNSKKRAAADPRLRPNGHRDRVSLIPAAKRNICLYMQIYLCDASN